MSDNISPAFIIIIGAFFVPLLKGKIKSVYLLFLPVLAFFFIISWPEGKHSVFHFMGYELIFGNVDRLSLVFGYIFSIALFIGMLFSLNVDDDLQHVSSFVYAGGALGVTFAGDVFSLYIFWELMAISSTFLILARRTKASQAAAFRYILVHVFGGLCLLAGIVLHVHHTGTTEISVMQLKGLASYLIFVGIAVNAAVYPLHPWLKDAYPEATVTGAVFLSAFTTKSAVYLMVRIFPGAELLIWLGAAMAVIPIIYAIVEDDIRRIIAYSLISQGGFMMCGIGIGTPLALNGTISHAFCCILYTALLFMATGSVIQMTGRSKCTELGGLYKTMPLTCIFCIIGAASISALPLFCGFISKSMVISASSHEKMPIIWLLLQCASACACFHAGIKVPFFTFFGKKPEIKSQEPPINMLLAMGITAFLCILIAVFYKSLYQILPHPVTYEPYTMAHIIGQFQVVLFGAFAFYIVFVSGYYPEMAGVLLLDTDWFYRKGGMFFYYAMDKMLNGMNRMCDKYISTKLPFIVSRLAKNTPAKLIIVLITPIQVIMGSGKDVLKATQKKVYRTFETCSTPIGMSVAAASLFIIMLFFMS